MRTTAYIPPLDDRTPASAGEFLAGTFGLRHQVEESMGDERFDDLQTRHAELDKQIRIEESRRVPDEDALNTLKKEKLALKDQLAGNVG
jgi:uncharacterized protein YdcH (DUF465 family)